MLCEAYPSEIGIEVEADDLVVSKYNPELHILGSYG